MDHAAQGDCSTCLHVACGAGHLDVVKYLCERGGEELLMQIRYVRAVMSVFVCVCVCLCLCCVVSSFAGGCEYDCAGICLHTHADTVSACMYPCLHAYVASIRLCVDAYKDVYIYIYIHSHTYIYIDMYISM